MSKFSISAFYGVLITYTSEVYPTKLRSQAYGFLMMGGRVATVALPYLTFAWELYVGYESLIMLAVVCLIALFTLFLLEETLDKDMDELQVNLLVSRQNSSC